MKIQHPQRPLCEQGHPLREPLAAGASSRGIGGSWAGKMARREDDRRREGAGGGGGVRRVIHKDRRGSSRDCVGGLSLAVSLAGVTSVAGPVSGAEDNQFDYSLDKVRVVR